MEVDYLRGQINLFGIGMCGRRRFESRCYCLRERLESFTRTAASLHQLQILFASVLFGCSALYWHFNAHLCPFSIAGILSIVIRCTVALTWHYSPTRLRVFLVVQYRLSHWIFPRVALERKDFGKRAGSWAVVSRRPTGNRLQSPSWV